METILQRLNVLNKENPYTTNIPAKTPADDQQPEIRTAQVITALSKLKRGKAAGPAEIIIRNGQGRQSVPKSEGDRLEDEEVRGHPSLNF